MKRPFLAALTLLAVSSSTPAFADFDVEERAWVAQCADKLQSKSDRVRQGAEDALVAAGIDVVDALALRADAGDAQHAAFERICMRIGRAEAADRLRAVAAKQADEGAKMRLVEMADRVAVAKAGGESPLAGRIAEILEPMAGVNRFSSDCPAVHALVALGHDAVPLLVDHLDPYQVKGMQGTTIEWALVPIVRPADVPRLRTALLLRRDQVARALGRLASRGDADAARALQDGVRADVFDWNVADALEESGDRAESGRVVVEWLRRGAAEREDQAAAAADLLGKLRPDGAAEALAPWIERGKDAQTKQKVGSALVSLGDARGVPLLIAVFADASASTWSRREASVSLDGVSGLLLAREAPRVSGRPTPEERKVDEDAATAYRAWWDASKDKLTFDPVSRSWSVE